MLQLVDDLRIGFRFQHLLLEPQLLSTSVIAIIKFTQISDDNVVKPRKNPLGIFDGNVGHG